MITFSSFELSKLFVIFKFHYYFFPLVYSCSTICLGQLSFFTHFQIKTNIIIDSSSECQPSHDHLDVCDVMSVQSIPFILIKLSLLAARKTAPTAIQMAIPSELDCVGKSLSLLLF